MAKSAPLRYGFHEAEPVRRPKLQLLMQAAKQFHGPWVDPAQQTEILPNVGAGIGLNFLGVGVGFDGYSVPDAPPDTTLSVGDKQVVEWVNVSYAVFDKSSGAVIAGPIEGNTLWSGFKGTACANNNDGDIIVTYDKRANRWLMAQNVFNGPPYYTCVAISETDDATGKWYRYQYPAGGTANEGIFPDYPKWGVWVDGYYQHNNGFGGTNGFQSEPCAFDRVNMLKGKKALQICFAAPTSFDDSMLPADLDSAKSLPAKYEPEVYLGSIDNANPGSNVYEYLFHVDFTHPTKSTFKGFGGTMPISVASYNLACGGFSDCAPQKGTSDVLEVLGDRLLYRLSYRSIGGHQTWLVLHDVTTSGGQVGPRWYEFRAPKGSTTLTDYQEGTFGSDGNYRWMGSLAMDHSGDILMGYSETSSSMYPSIYYTGRVPSDSSGTMETEAEIVAGSGAQTDTSDRWGDYSNMVPDPSDDCTLWYTQEFYASTGSFNWSTQLASLKFPGCQ